VHLVGFICKNVQGCRSTKRKIYKINVSNDSHPVVLKVIFVPTGKGGIVTGLWVGWEELWLDSLKFQITFL
jgi:threonine synthase